MAPLPFFVIAPIAFSSLSTHASLFEERYSSSFFFPRCFDTRERELRLPLYTELAREAERERGVRESTSLKKRALNHRRRGSASPFVDKTKEHGLCRPRDRGLRAPFCPGTSASGFSASPRSSGKRSERRERLLCCRFHFRWPGDFKCRQNEGDGKLLRQRLLAASPCSSLDSKPVLAIDSRLFGEFQRDEANGRGAESEKAGACFIISSITPKWPHDQILFRERPACFAEREKDTSPFRLPSSPSPLSPPSSLAPSSRSPFVIETQ